MKLIQLSIVSLMSLCGIIPQASCCNTLILDEPDEEMVELRIDENDRFLDVIGLLQCHFNEIQSEIDDDDENDVEEAEVSMQLNSPSELSLVVTHAGIFAKAKRDRTRNYETPVTREERNKIAFIVKTLGFDSVVSVGKEKSSLESAGKKIEHLHPFCFLKVVFQDEELKAGIAAIRDRISWIKNGFFDGIYGSLKDEAELGNLEPHIADFSKKLKVDESTVRSYIEKKKWKEFVSYLIDKIPREKDPKRYNM